MTGGESQFTIAHLMDDTSLGGITRSLKDQLPLHQGVARHELVKVATNFRLPHRIAADAFVVHFAMNWAKLPFLHALRLQVGRRPIIVQEHSYTGSFEELHVPSKGRFRAMLRRAYGLADIVVAVSHGQAAWLRESGLVEASKLTAIPQALDTTLLRDIPLPEWNGSDPLRLGAYGRYNPQKGFDILIEAMRGVNAAQATLRFAGYGAEEARMRSLADGMPHVSIEGQISSPAAFLSKVDAVVIPSHYEAFGLVALETRAAGRPFVATTVDGLSEQAGEGWAVTCKPHDPNALRQAILELRQRNLAEMGAAARQSARGALEANVVAWEAVYRRLADLPREHRRWGRDSYAMAAVQTPRQYSCAGRIAGPPPPASGAGQTPTEAQ